MSDRYQWAVDNAQRLQEGDEQNEHGWRALILRQQGEIETLLEESPSLHRLVADLAGKCYDAAARTVAVEFDVMAPEICPFRLEDVLGKRLSGPGGV